jgi:uncharacterized protein (DUF2249 family)
MPDDLLKPAQLVVDGREMQPPEPLEKTLEGLDQLQAGAELLLLVDCHPVPLFNILRNNGYVWREDVLEDGTHEIRIRRA